MSVLLLYAFHFVVDGPSVHEEQVSVTEEPIQTDPAPSLRNEGGAEGNLGELK